MRCGMQVILLMMSILGCDRVLPRKPEPPIQVTVAYTVQPQSTLVHVAVAKGYFAEEGLQITSLVQTYGKAALQAVLDHHADFATVAETPFMFAVLKGENVSVVANIEASTLNNAIVARKDAGILAPADLKGRRIGFTPGTTSDFFLDSMLTTLGLTRKEIRPVALKPEDMGSAIREKRVDAVSTWNYPLSQINKDLGPNGTLLYDRDIYTETFNIAAQQDFIQKNPEAVRRFLRALIKAEAFVVKDPTGAQAIMASSTKVDPALIREVWSGFRYQVALDQTLLITLEDETRWAMKNHLTDTTVMPDYRRYIHLEALKALRPDAVRMSH